MRWRALLIAATVLFIALAGGCGGSSDSSDGDPGDPPGGGPVSTDSGDGTSPDVPTDIQDPAEADRGDPDDGVPETGRVTLPDLSRGAPAVVWETSIGRPVETRPFRVGESLLVLSEDGYVLAYRVQDGSLIDTTELGRRVEGAAAISGDVICFPEGPKRLYGFLLARGTKLWTADVDGPITAGPIVAHGSFVLAGASAVHAYDPEEGLEAWTTVVGSAVTALAASPGDVAVGMRNGRIMLLDGATGEERWLSRATGDTPRHLAGMDDVLIVFGRQGSVGTVSLEDGSYTPLDIANIGPVLGLPGVDPDSGEVFVVDESGMAVGISVREAAVIWTQGLAEPSSLPVALAQAMVVIALDTGGVVALDRSDGSPLWSTDGEWWAPGGALLNDDGIVVVGRHGVLRRLVPEESYTTRDAPATQTMRFVPRSEPYEDVPVRGELYLHLPEAGVYEVNLPGQERTPVELRLYNNDRQVASNAGKVGLDSGFRVEVSGARELRMEVVSEQAGSLTLVVTRVDG